ncbi:MAG: hypothetical protein ACPGXK_10300 [Phycisphaerae bacterium]
MSSYDESYDVDAYAEEEFLDDEGPDEHDIARAESLDDSLVCPICSAEVHEDAQQCQSCGNWIIPVAPGGRTSGALWYVVVGIVLLAFLLIMLR